MANNLKLFFYMGLNLRNRINANSFISIRKFRYSYSLNTKGIVIKMPALSPTMTEGSIVKWLKNEGETFEAGDVLCEIQTDKAIVAFEADDEGILAKILKGDDTKDINIGESIAMMCDLDEDWKSVEVPSDNNTENNIKQAKPDESLDKSTLISTGGPYVGHAIGPAVKSLSSIHNIELSEISASGSKGNILKSDILKYIESRQTDSQHVLKPPNTDKVDDHSMSQQAKKLRYTDVPLSAMRKTIAKRLTDSKCNIPHGYVTSEANITDLLEIRSYFKSRGYIASLNDYIIKATALSLSIHPDVNVVCQADGRPKPYDGVDISIAVATSTGLITPIVRHAHQMSVLSIADTVRGLAQRAHAGSLKPAEFQGGSFTISNLGMFGIYEFSAIINPPQCAILAVSAGRRERALVAGGERTLMRLRLSYDARNISECQAACFMQTLASILSQPSLLRNDLVSCTGYYF